MDFTQEFRIKVSRVDFFLVFFCLNKIVKVGQTIKMLSQNGLATREEKKITKRNACQQRVE